MRASKQNWCFRVKVSELEKNEAMFVVGNVPELGSWNHNQAIQLSKESDGTDSPIDFESNGSPEFSECYNNSTDGLDAFTENTFRNMTDNKETKIFSQKIALPSDIDIEYRFFVAVICLPNGTKNSAETLIIRKWETHMPPRIIKKNSLSNIAEETLPEPDVFGYHNGYLKVERGWLTDETIIQFKLFNTPINLWKNKLQNKKMYIKMTPVNLVKHNAVETPQPLGECIDDSLSLDTQDIVDQPAFSVTEVAAMNDEECNFKYQAQFGYLYKEDEFIIFNAAVRYPESVGYLVDYYVYGSRSFPGEPPSHIGFTYILPSAL